MRVFVVALVLLVAAESASALTQTPTYTLEGGFIPSGSPDQQSTTMMFGQGLAVSGDIAVVGEPGVIGGPGRAYVYQFSDDGWELTQNMTSGHSTRDYYGARVVLSADASVLVVAAPRHGSGDGVYGTANGRVYVYTWNPLTSLFDLHETVDHPAGTTNGLQRFGTHVALSSDATRLFVSAQYVLCRWGSCPSTDTSERGLFVFTSAGVSDPTFSLETQLVRPETLLFDSLGQPFGISASGDTVWEMGYDMDRYNPQNTSVLPTLVQVYRRDGTTWSDAGTLQAPAHHLAIQSFGAAFVFDGEGADADVYVGAPHNDSTVFRYRGQHDPSTTTLIETFAVGNQALYETDDGTGNCDAAGEIWRTDGNFFGHALAISPNRLLLAVGAPFGVDAGQGHGNVYLYRRFSLAEEWTQIQQFQAPFEYALEVDKDDVAIYHATIDEFGYAVALTDSRLFVGAKGAGKVHVWDGMAAYLVRPPPSPPPPVYEIPQQPPSTSSGSIVLGLIIGLLILLLLLIVLFFIARFVLKKYIRKRLEAAQKESEESDDSDEADSQGEGEGEGEDEGESTSSLDSSDDSLGAAAAQLDDIGFDVMAGGDMAGVW